MPNTPHLTEPRAWSKVLRRAAWAPIGVLLLHRVVVWTGVREQADHLVHGCGGAAAAYFALVWCRVFALRLGEVASWVHHLAAFCVACTAGLFVELVEFASDVWLGTHVQSSIRETMLDLVSDVVGAVAALLLVAIWPRRDAR